MNKNYGLHVTNKSHVNVEDESDSVNFDDVMIDSVDEAYAYYISCTVTATSIYCMWL